MHSDVWAPDPERFDMRDGTRVIIRPIRPDDAPRLQSLFRRLSQESIYFRFLQMRKEMTHEHARRLADLDHHLQWALVATRPDGSIEEVIGVARYAVVPDSWPVEAEAAIVVEDQYQSKGLGTRLLERLAAHAIERGICAFVATIRWDNVRVLRLIRCSGLPTESRAEIGSLTLRVGLEWEPHRDTRACHALRNENMRRCQEARG